jgi:hypothetical protein
MNKPIIITGCQRSGTTLMNLILDSHPDITALDEFEFDSARMNEYLQDPRYHPCVAFKLPTEAAAFRSFKTLPGVKVIWCVRDPRDVVLSMLNLTMQIVNGHPISMANCTREGEEDEVEACLRISWNPQLAPAIEQYRRICQLPAIARTYRDGVLRAALIWEARNALLELYPAEGFPFMVVRYEDLVRSPRTTIGGLLSFLELPWHEDVLRHHQLHDKMYAGNTRGNRAIDPSNTEKWKQHLSAEDLELIWAICGDRAQRFGYVEAAPDAPGIAGDSANGDLAANSR